MGLTSTSRVFEAARQAKARLVEQTWPNNPETHEPPHIGFADIDYGAHGEVIQIGAREEIAGDSTISWRSMPGGRDEVFDLPIEIALVTGEMSEDDLIDRLEVLADIVQRAFYDDVNGTVLPLDIAQAVKLEGVGQVMFDPPFRMANSAGLVAQARVVYRLHFRI